MSLFYFYISCVKTTKLLGFVKSWENEVINLSSNGRKGQTVTTSWKLEDEYGNFSVLIGYFRKNL